ncbi:Killer toxin subunits alpha/beta-like protein [Emericellopsis cladophorae]|uniref:Killer toxin subunits alpha/beta-like protein n=1 Tax=Emericellopsis cladophorae TaxID=2686198 RepID=A0A9Q0BGL7_9HYPO|nr:Killer toxin subunits alpha/beta-like protein [Emericellopsis cladophorae]KAI6784627.1 Killer toxin subunits alpha/beta-like protein [Emericellopsis cladophorae]
MPMFKQMTDIKRFISFGGWDFSTKPETFNILREDAKPANRGTFKKNIIAFLDEHRLDGVDVDREYPGPDFGDGETCDETVNLDLYSECNATYNSLSALEDRKGKVPSHCMYIYIAKILSKMMEDALKKYDDMVEDGYDDKFKTFARYVKRQAPYQINAFMGNGKAGNFSKCEETGIRNCCGTSKWYCDHEDTEDCDDYDRLQEWKGHIRDYVPDRIQEQRNAGKNIKDCIKERNYFYWNYPEASSDIEISNPQDIIGDSHDESKDLASRLRVLIKVTPCNEVEDPGDLVDTAMLPALSIESAITGMEDVAEKVEEIEEAECVESIMLFISSSLFFIPSVGSDAGSVGLAGVRAILGILGSVAEAGLLSYSVVDDPDNAFATIFKALATRGLGRSGWDKAAKSKRDVPSKDLDALGVKKQVNRFENLKVITCKN